MWLLSRIVGAGKRNPIRSAIQLSKLAFTTAVKIASAEEIASSFSFRGIPDPRKVRPSFKLLKSWKELSAFKSSFVPFIAGLLMFVNLFHTSPNCGREV